MDTQRLVSLRAQKDHFFKTHSQSPLSAAQKQVFTGLSYFLPNPRLDLTVAVSVFEDRQDVTIQTTTGDTRWYRRYGAFEFNVGQAVARLTIYQTPHGYFLPFVDALAGTETYPAGRYLEPVALAEGQFHVDFNEAYNPYCAYGPQWSCPLTPAENRLSVAIMAGEKMPAGDWAALT
ncbi:MAG: DUF1684 domain-containing protein [Anaerolineae bacterium]|jgi:hypothetical protein|nr:DUF1684 domain-containing protein [Anaerolineae bacterium]